MLQEAVISKRIAEIDAPYSAALKVGDFLYISQQLPIDANGTVVSADSYAQAKQCLLNINALLNEEGLELQHILKLSVYITSPQCLKGVDMVLQEMLEAPYPARSISGVSFLPCDASVAIEAFAIDTRALEILCNEEMGCCDSCCSL